jgi:hypothetical protein
MIWKKFSERLEAYQFGEISGREAKPADRSALRAVPVSRPVLDDAGAALIYST